MKKYVNTFLFQYYTVLAKEPKFLHRFYGSASEMMHGHKDDQCPAVGQVKIRDKIKQLNFKDCHTKVKYTPFARFKHIPICIITIFLAIFPFRKSPISISFIVMNREFAEKG